MGIWKRHLERQKYLRRLRVLSLLLVNEGQGISADQIADATGMSCTTIWTICLALIHNSRIRTEWRWESEEPKHKRLLYYVTEEGKLHAIELFERLLRYRE